MEFHLITEADRPLFTQYIKNNPRSAYNFYTNLIWSQRKLVKLSLSNGCLVTLWDIGRSPRVLFPQGDGDRFAAVKEVIEHFKKEARTPRFVSLDEQEVMLLRNSPLPFRFSFDRDGSDYIYSRESLAVLSGKKLHAKKNHLNAFWRENRAEYKKMTAADVPECLRLYETWFSEKDESVKLLQESREATKMLMTFIGKAPELTGGVIRIDGKIAAFTVGEQITDDTALIHMEYADRTVRGLYPAINQQFVFHEWQNVLYINREEDMGDEGLRKAKESYHPLKLLNEYTAVLTK